MNSFTLEKGSWSAWQMFPGYFGERCVPYCSPIYLTGVKPRKSGKGVLNLEFLNVLYAVGVQDFDLDLKVMKRAENFLVGELIYAEGEDSGRIAVISHIEFPWVEQCCPELWYRRPPSSTSSHSTGSIDLYLNEVFFGGSDRAP